MMVVTQGRLTYRGPLELRTPTQLQMLCEIRSQGETHLQRRFARRQLGPGSLHCCFCIGLIKHKVASRLVLYLFPPLQLHIWHTWQRKFSEKGGRLGRKTTHMAQPPKKWEDFYAFPVKSEVEIKIQKEGRWACRDYHAISGRSGLPEWYPHVTLPFSVPSKGAACGRGLFPTSC